MQTPKPRYLIFRPLLDILGMGLVGGSQFLQAILENLLVRCWLGLRRQGERGSRPPRSVFYALRLLASSRGRCSSVLRGPRGPLIQPERPVEKNLAGSPRSSSVLQLQCRPRSPQTILLHNISSCWMPSIQSCIRAERKGH